MEGSKEFYQGTELLLIVSNLIAVDHKLLSIDLARTLCTTTAKLAKTQGETYALAFANVVIKTSDRFQNRLFVKTRYRFN